MGIDNDIVRKKQYESYLDAELEAAAMYEVLAEIEDNPERATIFRELVAAEMRHAARWAEKLGIEPSTLEPSPLGLKARIMQWAARRFGTHRVLPIMLKTEAKEISAYASDPEASDLVPEEREHSRVLRGLASADGTAASMRRLAGGGTLRAAVLGVNDGLVSNFSLVMGVAGGTSAATGGTGNPDFIILAGVAGLLAGAFSMAAGEYVSMRSQRDVFEFEMRKEAIELREWPEEEKEELILIYQAKGLPKDEAARLATRIMSDPKVALDTMAREELGLDPNQLGSPWGASISSFAAFTCGAAVPIIPYLLWSGDLSFRLSATMSAVALATVGAVIASMSGRSILWGGARMILAGSTAAAVTFGVGSLIGVSVAA